jgi:hypothetical protein
MGAQGKTFVEPGAQGNREAEPGATLPDSSRLCYPKNCQREIIYMRTRCERKIAPLQSSNMSK